MVGTQVPKVTDGAVALPLTTMGDSHRHRRHSLVHELKAQFCTQVRIWIELSWRQLPYASNRKRSTTAGKQRISRRGRLLRSGKRIARTGNWALRPDVRRRYRGGWIEHRDITGIVVGWSGNRMFAVERHNGLRAMTIGQGHAIRNGIRIIGIFGVLRHGLNGSIAPDKGNIQGRVLGTSIPRNASPYLRIALHLLSRVNNAGSCTRW